tara:strand:+ start:66 stop:461 length:396 start_codon:yes stop_codon:yes gene_type:complete
MIEVKGTVYRNALPEDEEDIYKLFEGTRLEVTPMQHPIIVAEQEGEIVGVVAVNPDFLDQAVVVEPLIAKRKMIFFKLHQAMEEALAAIGVKTFIFRVHVTQESYLRVVRKIGVYREFAEAYKHFWFRRDM